MWKLGWRESVWSRKNQEWDLIIIGGGITAAGIFFEAVKKGYKTLLVESGDFASGTSSKSSKMVHGGLRYLRNAKLQLTAISVREREWLIEQCEGLVTPVDFLLANYKRDSVPGWIFRLGLGIYDLIALKWQHQHLKPESIKKCIPLLNYEGLSGGFLYRDAETDDARLVLRILQAGQNLGGTAINYSRVIDLLQNNHKEVCGVVLRDESPENPGNTIEVKSKMIVNATGAWADEIRSMIGKEPRIRKLRGSHLFISAERLPLNKAITALHPVDNRPVYALPWEGVILIGTTDVDHQGDINILPCISQKEFDYLMTFVTTLFPTQKITHDDVISTHSGIRSVLDTCKEDPCKESREHIIWNENNLVTVTGGKLTTFRFMALEALKLISKNLTPSFPEKLEESLFDCESPKRENYKFHELVPEVRKRLIGRFGNSAGDLVNKAGNGELEPIPGTTFLWAELRYAARMEGAIHLSDLLLRRTRIGITSPLGGLLFLDKIKHIVQAEMKWSEARWAEELSSYRDLWHSKYQTPQ